MKIIIGNWKMNVGVRESVALARGTLLLLRGRKMAPEVIVCPSFIAISEVRKVLAHSAVGLGAQNMFWEDHGAFTGETSARFLTELGVTHVITGHSERRIVLGETDEMINKKMHQAISGQLVPVLCVGETAAERGQGIARDRVRDQLARALSGVRLRSRDRLFVAYEPVWAIGTGVIAEVSEVIAMHEYIRTVLGELFSDVQASHLRVLYGGSVEPENAYQLLRESQVDGVLVGGASVKLNQFKDIVAAAGEVLESQATV